MRLYGTTTGTGLDQYLDLKVTRGTYTPSEPAFDSCTNFQPDGTEYIAGKGNGVIYDGTLQGFPDDYAGGRWTRPRARPSRGPRTRSTCTSSRSRSRTTPARRARTPPRLSPGRRETSERGPPPEKAGRPRRCAARARRTGGAATFAAFTATTSNSGNSFSAAATFGNTLRVASGSYTGNDTDNRAITDPGFQPDLVIVKADTNQIGVARSSTMTGDASKPLDGTTALATRASSR